MKILVYPNVDELPGVNTSKLSTTLLTDEVLQDEPISELKDCLGAIMAFPIALVAHVFINRKPNFFGGSEVRIVVTSPPQDDGNYTTIWGIGYSSDREGVDEYVETFKVDVDLMQIVERARDEYAKQRKDFAGWSRHLKELFDGIRTEHQRKASYHTKMLSFLVSG